MQNPGKYLLTLEETVQDEQRKNVLNETYGK